MCTVTLTYNEKSALARRKLAALLSTGLFTQVGKPISEDADAQELHRETREAFLAGSKRSMSHIIARYV